MNEDFGLLGKAFQIGFIIVVITSLLKEILPSPWQELNNIVLIVGGILFLGSFMFFGLSISYSALIHLKNFIYKLIRKKRPN